MTESASDSSVEVIAPSTPGLSEHDTFTTTVSAECSAWATSTVALGSATLVASSAAAGRPCPGIDHELTACVSTALRISSRSTDPERLFTMKRSIASLELVCTAAFTCSVEIMKVRFVLRSERIMKIKKKVGIVICRAWM
jgi:hypothetical protein